MTETERQKDQRWVEETRAEYLQKLEGQYARMFQLTIKTDAGTFTWDEWQRRGRP